MSENKDLFEEAKQFASPFGMIVAGQSQSGKTVFISKLLQNLSLYIDPPPNSIIVSYAEDQSAYEDIKEKVKNVQFVKGLDFEIPEHNQTLIIIDDQMTNAVKEKRIHQLFTQGIHHKLISVIYISQSLFPKGVYSVDIRKNTNYYVIMKSPTFKGSILDVGRQWFPKNPKFLLETYEDVSSKSYSYLVIDLHPKSSDKLRVQSGIFPGEDHIVHIP